MDTPDDRESGLKPLTLNGQSLPPLMDIGAVRTEMLAWLAELRLPSDSPADSWIDLIQTHPTTPEDRESDYGARVRLTLRLDTRQNKYLISIIECLEPDSRGTYVIGTHVNWQNSEQQLQKLVEESYRGHFDDILRARHTLWAQTFRAGELYDALACCARAILANELVARKPEEVERREIRNRRPAMVQFPKAEET